MSVLTFIVDLLKNKDFSSAMENESRQIRDSWNGIVGTLEDVTGADFSILKSGDRITNNMVNSLSSEIEKNWAQFSAQEQRKISNLANAIANIDTSVGDSRWQEYESKVKKRLQDKMNTVEQNLTNQEAAYKNATDKITSAQNTKNVDERSDYYYGAKNLNYNIQKNIEKPIKEN